MNKNNILRLAALTLSATALAGCASFSADGGFDEVGTLTRERTGQDVRFDKAGRSADADAIVQSVLAKPLTPDSAVRLALVNNRGLQSRFAELGVSEADLVQAGRLRNPGVS
ncbi:RND transporter, partial [Oxalobacteraceae bacterium OM1]